jgi:hypothetical protein
MSHASGFELIKTQGWRAGFDNLLRAEFSSWWKTRMWWTLFDHRWVVRRIWRGHSDARRGRWGKNIRDSCLGVV